jgi:hypothetical protein
LIPENYEDPESYEDACQRKIKIHQTNFAVQPKRLLKSLHRKTHFNGADAISQKLGCLQIKTRLFNAEFIEIKANLEGKARNAPAKTQKSTTAEEDEDARLLKQQRTNNA